MARNRAWFFAATRTIRAAFSRSAPAPPRPAMPSMTSEYPHGPADSGLAGSSGSGLPPPRRLAGKSGSPSTSTAPPRRRNVASARSCGASPSSTASTPMPSAANSDPAYRASPPLPPEPTSSRTRVAYRPRKYGFGAASITFAASATALAACRINSSGSSCARNRGCSARRIWSTVKTASMTRGYVGPGKAAPGADAGTYSGQPKQCRSGAEVLPEPRPRHAPKLALDCDAT